MLDLAKGVADSITAASVIEDGRRSWDQAEHRSRPHVVEAQTGSMQGAASIGSFLLHLATIDDRTSAKIPLPDVPFSR